jgi:hypothetical protein
MWLAIPLCLVNPVLAFTLLGNWPEDRLGWILLIPGTVYLSFWIAMPGLVVLLLLQATRRPIIRWTFLLLSAAATARVAMLINLPFKTASSMAGTLMSGPAESAGILVIAGGVILYLDSRLRPPHLKH